MNNNYLLNSYYYEEFTYSHFGECNDRLIDYRLEPYSDHPSLSTHDFKLTTTYPGLLVGLGYTHEAGDGQVKEEEKDGAEIKLGFMLDYVTGLPIIPGSTIKGALSSAFRKYKSALPEDFKSSQKHEELFGSEEKRGSVIFYDAIPISGGINNKIFGLDNITPHPDRLKAPIPLTMLKVIPDVTFQFRFRFPPSFSEDCAKKTRDLFKEIIMKLAIGAKSNVGYGVMKEFDETQRHGQIADTQRSRQAESPAKRKRQEGKCIDCGADTKPIKKLKDQGILKYHERCHECNERRKKG